MALRVFEGDGKKAAGGALGHLYDEAVPAFLKLDGELIGAEGGDGAVLVLVPDLGAVEPRANSIIAGEAKAGAAIARGSQVGGQVVGSLSPLEAGEQVDAGLGDGEGGPALAAEGALAGKEVGLLGGVWFIEAAEGAGGEPEGFPGEGDGHG